MAKRKRRFMTPKAGRRKARKKRNLVSDRRKKEFTYRGRTVSELMEMPLLPSEDDPDAIAVVQLLPSRIRRTLDRMDYEREGDDIHHLRDRIKEANGGTVRTHGRNIPVLPEFVGATIGVHNGQSFVPVEIKPEMIGHYLGEFAPTRRSVAHSGPGVGATRSSKHVPLK